MPLIYYLLIVVSANGTVTIAPPFQTEYACEQTKASVLLGHKTVKEQSNSATIPALAVGCQRVVSRKEHEA